MKHSKWRLHYMVNEKQNGGIEKRKLGRDVIFIHNWTNCGVFLWLTLFSFICLIIYLFYLFQRPTFFYFLQNQVEKDENWKQLYVVKKISPTPSSHWNYCMKFPENFMLVLCCFYIYFFFINSNYFCFHVYFLLIFVFLYLTFIAFFNSNL